jgi:hypothetical protein
MGRLGRLSSIDQQEGQTTGDNDQEATEHN